MIKKELLPGVFLGILAVLSVLTVLHFTSSIVLPCVMAALISFVVSPAVNFLHKRMKIPRYAAIIIVMLLIMTMMSLVGVFFYSSVRSFAHEYPKYSGKLTLIISGLLSRFDLPPDAMEQFSWVRTISTTLLAVSRQFIDFFSSLVLMMLVLVFLLFEQASLRPKVREAFQKNTTHRIFVIYAHIARQIGKYLSVKLLISFATGLCVWLALVVVGVDFAFLWGVIAFFFNFIPNIGSIIVAILIELFVILQFYPSIKEPVIALIAIVVIVQVLGNIVEPNLLGGKLDMSPLIIIVSLVIWGWIWGVMGMFLAVPLTVAIKIVLENIPYLRPAAILMGTGRNAAMSGKSPLQEQVPPDLNDY